MPTDVYPLVGGLGNVGRWGLLVCGGDLQISDLEFLMFFFFLGFFG